MLTAGDPAPDFTLLDDRGRAHRLSDYRGRKVLLWFYPKDDTPGWTREACGFRDGLADYQRLGVVVLGVSADSVESHAAFRDKFQLNFPLLADPTHAMCEAYGAWPDSQWGWGVARISFLIDGEGRVERAFGKVNASAHPGEVLALLAGA